MKLTSQMCINAYGLTCGLGYGEADRIITLPKGEIIKDNN